MFYVRRKIDAGSGHFVFCSVTSTTLYITNYLDRSVLRQLRVFKNRFRRLLKNGFFSFDFYRNRPIIIVYLYLSIFLYEND